MQKFPLKFILYFLIDNLRTSLGELFYKLKFRARICCLINISFNSRAVILSGKRIGKVENDGLLLPLVWPLRFESKHY